MTTMGLSPILSAFDTTNLVCGSGPSAASTSTSAPSTMLRMRSTSPPKSAWPGVSTILMRVSFQRIEVTLDRMVMPRSRSRSLESMARSATRWFSRNEPDCCSSRSTSVVLPWSTWAMMAILRSFIFLSRKPLRAPGARDFGPYIVSSAGKQSGTCSPVMERSRYPAQPSRISRANHAGYSVYSRRLTRAAGGFGSSVIDHSARSSTSLSVTVMHPVAPSIAT